MTASWIVVLNADGTVHAPALGLSLVQDVIVAHGGTVQIESSTDPGRSGTTVRLMFPAG